MKNDNSTKQSNASKPMLALGRLTYKKLIIWLNNKFQELEIKNYVVTDIARTYYSQNDYECGACRLMIYFENKQLDTERFENKTVNALLNFSNAEITYEEVV